MQPIARPTQVHIFDSRKTVELDWDDGHKSAYPWWYLRGFCPCAVCQGHSGGLNFVLAPLPDAGDAIRLTSIDEVGQYALNIVWDETHTTGIYTFEALRAMCPCAACRRHKNHAAQQLPHERLASLA